MTTVGLVAASLVLGVIVSSWLAIRANIQHDRAVAAERRQGRKSNGPLTAERTANRERNSARDAERRAQEQRDETRRLLYPADMIVAQQAWDAGDVAGAMEILDRHVPQENEEDLRGFHWTCLRRLCDRSLARKPIRYPERISSVALSPDGKMVAAASTVYAEMVYVWDVATGDRVDPGLAGQAVACSPHDATFAILDGSGIRLWNPDTGMREERAALLGRSRARPGVFQRRFTIGNRRIRQEGPRLGSGRGWRVHACSTGPSPWFSRSPCRRTAGGSLQRPLRNCFCGTSRETASPSS